MPSKEETLAQIDGLNQKVDAQEQRAKDMIAAKDAAIAELNALIEELKARPEVPDEVTDRLATVATNLEDNFPA